MKNHDVECMNGQLSNNHFLSLTNIYYAFMHSTQVWDSCTVFLCFVFVAVYRDSHIPTSDVAEKCCKVIIQL